MKLDIIAEVWSMAKESIIVTDRDSVAENLVTILIDHDFSPRDIKSAFADDPYVSQALKDHVDDAIDFEDDDLEYEEYEEDFDIDDDEDY